MGKVLAGAGVLLLSMFIVVVMMVGSFGDQQACRPGASAIDPSSVPQGSVQGYEHDQLMNAAIIAKVAADRGLPARAQLVGVMTAMGESSLRNIGYGDDIHGVTNPDGSLTCSLGLFQQQWCLGWGTREQVLDPVYAAGAFFDRLVQIPSWDSMEPTLAINRVQGNSDPYHYAKFESTANEILAALGGVKPGIGGCAGSGEWQSPINVSTPGLHIEDFYGMRSAALFGHAYLHSGLDLAGVPVGTPILAASSGTVDHVSTVDQNDEGMNVRIKHADGSETRYLHLSQTLVREGDKVSAGTPIGALGNTGLSTGAHLHFGVWVDGAPIDPIPFTRARGLDLCTLPIGNDLTVANSCK
ncbi:M23 family metallopeptidase [Microbacterium lacticum]